MSGFSEPSNLQEGVRTLSGFFLRAKSWQLFCLLFILPLVTEMLVSVPIPSGAQSVADLGRSGLVLLLVFELYMACFMAWFWAIGTFSGDAAKAELKMDRTFFRLAIGYPPVYTLWFFFTALGPDSPPIFVIVPLHLFCMFCLLYDMHFASKSLAIAEMGRQVNFYDYAAAFFLLWFYPIGIWIVQPRVNRLFAQSSQAVPSPPEASPDS